MWRRLSSNLPSSQALQGEDLFLDVLSLLLVDVGFDDTVEELECFIRLVDALHGEEVGETRAGVPAVHAAGEEFLGRMGGGVHHEVDELMECILCHEKTSRIVYNIYNYTMYTGSWEFCWMR